MENKQNEHDEKQYGDGDEYEYDESKSSKHEKQQHKSKLGKSGIQRSYVLNKSKKTKRGRCKKKNAQNDQKIKKIKLAGANAAALKNKMVSLKNVIKSTNYSRVLVHLILY